MQTRTIEIDGIGYQLQARRADDGDGWISGISRTSITGHARFPGRPLLDGRSVLHGQVAVAQETYGSGASAQAALDDLERVLREGIAASRA